MCRYPLVLYIFTALFTEMNVGDQFGYTVVSSKELNSACYVVGVLSEEDMHLFYNHRSD